MAQLSYTDPEVKRAIELYEAFQADEKAYLAYESRRMWEHDQASRQAEAREEGIAIGIEQGIERGIEKVAMTLIGEGAENDFISKVTGLSVTKIQELRNQ